MKAALLIGVLIVAGCSAAGGDPRRPSGSDAGGAAGGEGGEGGGLPELPARVDHEGPQSEGPLWSRAWGGTGSCHLFALAVGPDGSVYATGRFYGKVDFDPSEGQLVLPAEVNSSGFLVRLAPDGAFAWASSWGAGDAVKTSGWGSEGLAVRPVSGGVFVGGQAAGTLHLTPSSEYSPSTSGAGFEPILMRFTDAGELEWGRTWPMRRGRVTSIGNTERGFVLSGQFDTAFSFAGSELVPAGEADCFLGLLSSQSEEVWGTSWGGPFSEYFCASAAAERIAVTGTFDWPVNFGDGPQLGEKTARAGDAFLLETELDGTRRYVRQWGGYDLDNGVDVAALADGYVAVGEYFGDLDFGAESLPVARGAPSAFVARVDANGDLLWKHVFEPTVESGRGRIHVRDVATDGERILVSGGFAGEVDFGTGPLRFDGRESARALDGFVVAFDLDGGVLWSRSLPAWGNDLIYGVDFATTDGQQQVVVGGHFAGVADLGFGGEPDVWSSRLDACYVAKLPADLE